MARKGKTGLDYFSHDVNMRQDIKVKILKAKHGFIAYGIYMALLEEAYKEGGYFLKVDDDFNVLFVDENNLDYEVYEKILKYCVEKELFDKKIFEKYNVITSKRMQSNFIEGTQRRKQVEFVKEYLLIDCLRLYPTEKINVNILTLNDNINEENVNTGTQKKKKGKRKEIESKEDNNLHEKIIDYLNQKTGKSFKQTTESTKKHINARLKESYVYDDFVKVIDNKCYDWLNDSKMNQWLKPDTLFSTKFEGYLNQVMIPSQAKQKYKTTDEIQKEIDSKKVGMDLRTTEEVFYEFDGEDNEPF